MHNCIGPKSKHERPESYSNDAILDMYRKHQTPGWYEAALKRDPNLIPARVRRWMRMIKQEVHQRGLTP